MPLSYRLRVLGLVCSLLLLRLGTSTTHAQVVIDSLSGNGILQWSGSTNNLLGYNIEWAPTLQGPWSTNWPSMTGIPLTGTVYNAQVPMFYRVVGITRPPGETADTAPLVTAGTYAGTTVGFTNNYAAGTGCASMGGPDRVYQIIVPAGQRLTVVATPAAGYDLSLSLLTSFAQPLVCLGGADSYGTGMAETLVYNNPTGADVLIYAVIASYTANQAGSYSINFTLQAMPPGDLLENAIAAFPGSISGSTAGCVNDYNSGTGCTGTAGPDRAYMITVPAGQRLTATVTPEATFNVAVNLVQGNATPRVCVAGADSGSAGVAESVSYNNGSFAPVNIYVVVESSVANATGSFMLDLTLTDMLAGELIDNATPITTGTIMGSTVGYANDYGSGTSCASSAGPDRVYGIVVPAGKRLDVTLTPEASYNASVNLMAGNTSPRVCLTGADSGSAGVQEWVSYNNVTPTATIVYIVVESATTSGAGTYSLTTAFSDILPGDVAMNAPLVTAGSYSDSLTGYCNDYGAGTGCSSTLGPERLYQITVPAGQRLNVLLTPSGWDGVLNLMQSAGAPRTCVAGVDARSSGQAEALIYTNTSASDVTYYVVVESYTALVGNYTLELSLGLPPGETCANAEPIEPGTYSNLSTAIYLNDYTPSGCLSSQPGRDRVFSVSVPAGQTLTASVVPIGGYSGDPSIYLVAACGASPLTCLAGDDSGSSSAMNVASYKNNGATAQTIYIVIDSYSSISPVWNFQLNVTLAP